MKKHLLQEWFEKAEYVCEDYSGRGMFGKRCLAVQDVTPQEFLKFVLCWIDNRTNTSEFREEISHFRTDSLGKGTVLYFPEFPLRSNYDRIHEKINCYHRNL